jgi:hypothetical protein
MVLKNGTVLNQAHGSQAGRATRIRGGRRIERRGESGGCVCELHDEGNEDYRYGYGSSKPAEYVGSYHVPAV